jgi:PGAP2IP, second transmembrane domain
VLLWFNWNVATITLCAAAAFWHIYENLSGAVAAEKERTEVTKKDAEYPWARAGLGVGGIMGILHTYYAGHGTIPRYVEFQPFPASLLVVSVLLLGVLLMRRDSLVRSPKWFMFAMLCAFMFIAGQNRNPVYPYSFLLTPEVEFFGALGLGVYAVSSMLRCWERMAKVPSWSRRGKAVVLAVFTYHMFEMWGIYPPSYKFMDPVFGPILRERHMSLCFAMVLCIGLGQVGELDAGIRDFWSDLVSKTLPKGSKNRSMSFVVVAAVTLIFWGLLFPVGAYRAHVENTPPEFLRDLPENPNVGTQRDMLVGRKPIPLDIRGLGTAIHFGYTNYGGNSAEELVRVVRENNANVVGLVESDNGRGFLGNKDYVEFIGAELGFYTEYGPSTAQNTWGCALFPIVRVNRVVLPSPEGELACLTDADILVNGTRVQVLVTHVGNTEDELDVKLQHEALRNVISQHPAGDYHPTMLISYMIMDPWLKPYEGIISSGLWDTSNELNRYCIYVLYRDLQFIGFERVDKGDVSDTEQQIGAFRILPDGGQSLKTLPAGVDAPVHCRQFHNDTIACQARRHVCGWCQKDSWGTCVEPAQHLGCRAVDGVWIGANNTDDDNAAAAVAGAPTSKQALAKSFTGVAIEQLNKGIHHVEVLGGNKATFTTGAMTYQIGPHERDQWNSPPLFIMGRTFELYWKIYDDAADRERDVSKLKKCVTPGGDPCTWGECDECICPAGVELPFCRADAGLVDYRSFQACIKVQGDDEGAIEGTVEVEMGVRGSPREKVKVELQGSILTQCAFQGRVDQILKLADAADDTVTLEYSWGLIGRE